MTEKSEGLTMNQLAENNALLTTENMKLQQQVNALESALPLLQEQDLKALLRFNDTCEDGEGYDIGKDAMMRLLEIGVASKGPHGIRNITAFGQWVIDLHNGEDISQPLKTEDDNAHDWAVFAAQLRAGEQGGDHA